MSFDWSNLKSVIGNTLPVIAGVIGTPASGIAVKAICNVLGLGDQSSPDDIASAFKNATPEQIIKLKEIDSLERIRMEEISSNEFIRSHEIAAGDTSDARKRNDGKTDILSYIMAGSVVGLLFICLLMIFFGDIDGQEANILYGVTSSLLTILITIGNFCFGTSASSRAKDVTIANLNSNRDAK